MENKPFLQRQLFGMYYYEFLAVLIFYVFCALSYYFTLGISMNKSFEKWVEYLEFNTFWRTAGLDYLLKLLLTIPIWWLIFLKLKPIPLKYRLLVHFFSLPLFLLSFKSIYYWISDQFDWWRLAGGAQIWDIYIPGLFYLIQFGIFHAYEYYRDNQRQLELKAALKEAALKSELVALKAQLNPHFLYNVFNTISASVPPEQEKTRDLIAKLSDLFRYQLKASKLELVPLREELAFIENYLDLEKARFEERLQINIDVPEAVKDALVPPMILQPLVENSVKHGIASLIEGGEIAIHIRKNGSKIEFEIADTGVGVKDKSKLFGIGVGLTNTKLRLEKQYNSELKILDNIPKGLRVQFSI